ncbi:hypothetical protein [Streptomyces sp. NPDC012825]|uniref:hypothetical protein n=1 Tax=Streptomyces sp. NPDC012825 TaxID=3364851 RepID=UPI0036C4B61F
MLWTHPDLVEEVCHALGRAGFLLVHAADDCSPGLRVGEVEAGAVVSWNVSGGFAAPAGEQRADSRRDKDASGDSMRTIVRAAVSGLLIQLGYTVAERPGDGELLVLSGGARLEAAGSRSVASDRVRVGGGRFHLRGVASGSPPVSMLERGPEWSRSGGRAMSKTCRPAEKGPTSGRGGGKELDRPVADQVAGPAFGAIDR